MGALEAVATDDLSNYDDLDRRIAAALQVDGRATWQSIADALGESARTVTRRGQRLLDDDVVNVSVYVDLTRVAHARPLVVRLRCEADRTEEAAWRIAERPDASSLSIVEGPCDIIALLLASDQDAVRRLLLHDMPSVPGVVQASTSTILKFFRSGFDWHVDLLTNEERAALASPQQRPPLGPQVVLDRLDQAITDVLVDDGRTPVKAVAARVDAAPATVRRRLTALFESGALHRRTEVVPALFGLGVEAMILLRVRASDLEDVGTRLAMSSSVRFCAAITGESQLLLDVLTRDEHQLYQFMVEVLGALPNTEIESSQLVVQPVRRGPLTLSRRNG